MLWKNLANNIHTKEKSTWYSMAIFILTALFSLTTFCFLTTVHAQQTEEVLKEQIEENKEKIEQLDEEIKQQQKKVDEATKERYTLQDAVSSLESSERRLTTNLSKTKQNISIKTAELSKLTDSISDTEADIQHQQKVIKNTIHTMYELDSLSLVEVALSHDSLSEFWNTVHNLEILQKSLADTVETLKQKRSHLASQREETVEAKNDLEGYEQELAGEKEAITHTKTTKAELLRITQNKEENYKNLLLNKIAQKDAIEAALNDFESQLEILLDKSAYPSPRNGILSWPVSDVRITQQFGGTQFAKTNPHVYGRAFHNGTDFGIPIGTKIKAVTDGVVRTTGNTDAIPGCYSWGKWVLVDHNNGLSTLYAHLSSDAVSPGQKVSRGQTIAYSGNTGYSTGPHLHLTLYATQGVSIKRFEDFKKSTKCAGAKTPVAAHEAYLDPMAYLPK